MQGLETSSEMLQHCMARPATSPMATNKSSPPHSLPAAQEVEFSFKDGKKLWSLVWNQENLVEKKRRWLQSMIPNSGHCQRQVKRPKFLADLYLDESDVRSDEVSCEKVQTNVERSFGLRCNSYKHHVVQDGSQILNLQKMEDGSVRPESFMALYSIMSKLSNEALLSVATIVTHNRLSFKKIRLKMKRIIKVHLPNYLANVSSENELSQLSEILRSPWSYRSDFLNIITPISPLLLSSINEALEGLDELPSPELVAVNRKLRSKSRAIKFPHEVHTCKKDLLIERVKKKCRQIISNLEEGNHLPKNLAKALSVINLSRKKKSRCMDIPQSEFFPFSEETMSLQNDILNALWSLSKVKHDELKMLHPTLDPDSRVQFIGFRLALRKYLTGCLFECDEGNLPDEALNAIAFINRSSRRQPVILTEEREKTEVGAVLNLSSQLKALTSRLLCDRGAEECSSDDSTSLGSDDCSEDNDFVLSGTNYFFISADRDSEHQKMDAWCLNGVANTAEVSDCSSNETLISSPSVAKAEDFRSESKEFLGKALKSTEASGDTGSFASSKADANNMKPDMEKVDDANHLKAGGCSAVDNMKPNLETVDDGNHVKSRGCSEVDLYEVCDETATMAHKLIGHMLDKFLLVEKKQVDGFTRCYLQNGLVSQDPDDAEVLLDVPEENPQTHILVYVVENLLPSLPKSCIDRVKKPMELS